MNGSVRRFACTQCGKCCNRSPEVELSEAAALADVFVFQLMFRAYSMPIVPVGAASESNQIFYQKKRLLTFMAGFALMASVAVADTGDRKDLQVFNDISKTVQRYSHFTVFDNVEAINYLMISALAMDTSPGACAALQSGRCSIHDRRPLGCRTVPFHHSRPDGLAASDFDSFVTTPGYTCDTSESAPLFWKEGRIVDEPTLQARADALAVAERDRPWKQAIVRRMKTSGSGAVALPSLQEVEANAGFAAMTTSMRVGWEIAADAGVISHDTYRAAVEMQLAAIEREFARGESIAGDQQTLREMRAEYQQVRAAVR